MTVTTLMSTRWPFTTGQSTTRKKLVTSANRGGLKSFGSVDYINNLANKLAHWISVQCIYQDMSEIN